jgi:hypothetical protein
MVIERKNNHPLQNADEYISREDINAIMKDFLPKVRALNTKISFEQNKVKQNSSTILDYSI